jgi:hypothetical protein
MVQGPSRVIGNQGKAAADLPELLQIRKEPRWIRVPVRQNLQMKITPSGGKKSCSTGSNIRMPGPMILARFTRRKYQV